VRSSTLVFSSFSRLRCCTGVRMIDDDEADLLLLDERLQLFDLAGAEQCRRLRLRHRDDRARDDVEIDGRSEALGLDEAILVGALHALRDLGGNVALPEDGNEDARPRHRLAVFDRASRRAVLVVVGQSVFPGLVPAIVHVDGLRRHDRGYGVFVDELRVPVAAKQDAKIVERGDDTRQLDAVDEKDRQRNLLLADGVEEEILEILGALGHAGRSDLVLGLSRR